MRFRVLSEAICSGLFHEFFAELKNHCRKTGNQTRALRMKQVMAKERDRNMLWLRRMEHRYHQEFSCNLSGEVVDSFMSVITGSYYWMSNLIRTDDFQLSERYQCQRKQQTRVLTCGTLSLIDL